MQNENTNAYFGSEEAFAEIDGDESTKTTPLKSDDGVFTDDFVEDAKFMPFAPKLEHKQFHRNQENLVNTVEILGSEIAQFQRNSSEIQVNKRKLSTKGLAARLAFRTGNLAFKVRQNSSNFTIGSANNRHASFSVASGTNEAGWTKVPSQNGLKSSFGYAAFKGWV